MTKQETVDTAAKAVLHLLKEFEKEFGVYFSIDGCCVCTDTTLEVYIPGTKEDPGASAVVFTYDIKE